MIIPVCLFILVQYYGSFPFAAQLSNMVLYIFRIVGICSPEAVVPVTESLILFSPEAAKVFAFNSHTLCAFVALTFICLAMNAIRTDRVAKCYVRMPVGSES